MKAISSRRKPTLNHSFLELLPGPMSYTQEWLFIAVAACLVTYVALENLHGHF
jgi:hypothetical protein